MHLPKYTKDGNLFPNSNFKSDTYYKSVNFDDAKKHGGNIENVNIKMLVSTDIKCRKVIVF